MRDQQNSGDYDHVSSLPGYLLRRAATAMMAELANRLASTNLRISEATVLLLISERTDLTSSQIGKTLEIQRANMAPLLNRMEASGLIKREPLDRKSHAILLTGEGIQRLATVMVIVENFEADLMARLPAEHRSHFVPALKALLQ